MFKDTAVESLTLSLELFNRPSIVAREHAVVMMLAHAFEMLLKATIFQRRRTIRDKGGELSHSLLRCVEIARSDLGIISDDERTVLIAIKQDRDCATHDIIIISDQFLWLHMRAGVSLFRRLLRDEFGEMLADLLPTRVIPVSASPPSDLSLLVKQELTDIRALLATGRRRSAEAAARLRPLLSLDGSSTGRSDQPTDLEVGKAAKALRDGAEWRSVFPGLANLQIASSDGSGDAQEVVLRIGKAADSVPVRRARPDESSEALAYRGVSPFEEFSIKLTNFGKTIGVTQTEGYGVIHALGLKEDERAYFIRRTKAGNVQYQGLSARAVELGKRALLSDDFDLAAAKSAYLASIRKPPATHAQI